jgi:eukaryotic-like serine/threonine-protein kinase
VAVVVTGRHIHRVERTDVARYAVRAVASTPRGIDAGVGVGEIFLDKFRVDAILGHGGMGVVAACTHLALNERVAIKMLRRDVLDDADAVERFMREAQAASKLKSEYVARVTDVGRSRANVPYMVMEYLYGHDLDELLAERGNLGLPWAVELTLQACDALGEAHSLGIVHRDVKPSNLFVTWRPDGSPLIKVLDFGISKALHSEALRLTQTQSLLGTPAYMSPEQMRSARHVDARTDIWSLGTVLYEMLEGRRPFEAESFSEMCVKVAVDPPGAMTHTPLALQPVVLRCLAKSPEQRYASMAELGRELVPFSHDPHHAQVLADRMARTLRRSQLFDSGPARTDSLGGPRPDEPIGAPTTLPTRPTPPTPRAIPSPRTPPELPVPPPLDPTSAATRNPAEPRLSRTYVVPRRRRRRAVLIAAALAGAAMIGVVVSRTRDPSPSTRAITDPPSTSQPVTPPRPAPAPPLQDGASPSAQAGSSAPGAPVAAPDPFGPAAPPADSPPARPRDRTRKKAPAGHKNDAAADKPPCDPFAESHAATACPPERGPTTQHAQQPQHP